MAAAAVTTTVVAFPAHAAASTARLQVDWSADFDKRPAPAVNLYAQGGYRGQCGGPAPPGDASVCRPAAGFHWEQARPNAGGYAQSITVVDDQPERAERFCFEIKHLAPTGHYDVTAVVTDPGGASRTLTYGLEKGQTTPLVCSPDAAPQPAPLQVPPAPAWWSQGRTTVLKRGGSCVPTTTEKPKKDPTTGFPAGTFSEQDVTCKVPSKTKGRVDACARGASSGDPGGDAYFFYCEVLSPAGPKARIRCFRGLEDGPHGRDDHGAMWNRFDLVTKRVRFVKTLARCLQRKPAKGH
jgi:hypothetical protein